MAGGVWVRSQNLVKVSVTGWRMSYGFMGRGEAWWSVDGQQEACFGRIESAWEDVDVAGVAGSCPGHLGHSFLLPGGSVRGLSGSESLALAGPSSREEVGRGWAGRLTSLALSQRRQGKVARLSLSSQPLSARFPSCAVFRLSGHSLRP